MYKKLLLLFVLVANNVLACPTVSKDPDQTITIGTVSQDNANTTADQVTSSNINTSGRMHFSFTLCSTAPASSHWFVPSKPPFETLTDSDGDWSLYETAFDGIYYAIQAKDSGGSWAATVDNVLLRSHVNNSGWYTAYARSKIVLKGKIMPGSYTINQPIGKAALSSSQTEFHSIGSVGEINVNLSATVNITGPTCDINAADKDQTVVMNAISSSFTGVGSTASPNSFQIRLNCEAGVSLIAYMADSNTPGNTSQILSLGHHSTASGFGLQLFENGSATPVSYGKINQWNIGGPASNAQKNYTIPFMAEYIQTDTTVTTGTVEAQSTITFLYH